ncbi:MAG: LytR C-terminal domain-containing protein [Pseudomonadota bacterium]
MSTLRPLSVAVFGACLLQGCSAPPIGPGYQVQPVMQLHHGANQTADAYYQLGKYHQGLGDLELALTAYNYAIARDAQHLEARNAAAAIHAGQGRLDQAKAMLLDLVAEYPTLAQALNNLGYVYYLQGDYEAATATLRQAVRLDIDNTRTRNNLRLAEAGGARVADVATPVAAPVADVVRPAPQPEMASKMALIQLQPNVYELKLATTVPAPLPLASVAPAEQPVAEAVPASRLEISNGNGIDGMARRIGTLLRQRGIAVARLTNEKPYRQPETKIQYRSGYLAQAEALKRALRGNVVLSESEALSPRSDLRLVLGKDAGTQLAVLLPENEAVVLAMQ